MRIKSKMNHEEEKTNIEHIPEPKIGNTCFTCQYGDRPLMPSNHICLRCLSGKKKSYKKAGSKKIQKAIVVQEQWEKNFNKGE